MDAGYRTSAYCLGGYGAERAEETKGTRLTRLFMFIGIHLQHPETGMVNEGAHSKTPMEN